MIQRIVITTLLTLGLLFFITPQSASAAFATTFTDCSTEFGGCATVWDEWCVYSGCPGPSCDQCPDYPPTTCSITPNSCWRVSGPTSLAASCINSSGNTTLSWSYGKTAQKFIVKVTDTTDNATTYHDNGTNKNLTISADRTHSYSWQVQSVDTVTGGGTNYTPATTTDLGSYPIDGPSFTGCLPSDPSNITYTCSTSGTSVTLNWGAASYATSYLIRMNKSPLGDWYNSAGGDFFAGGTTTSDTMTIANDTDYQSWVQGKNAAGDGSNIQGPLLNCPAPVCTNPPNICTDATSIMMGQACGYTTFETAACSGGYCCTPVGACNTTCSGPTQCASGTCFSGACRESACKTESTCICPTTAPATATTAPPTATSTTAPPTATSTTAPPTATSTTAPPTATSTTAPPTATSTTAPPTWKTWQVTLTAVCANGNTLSTGTETTSAWSRIYDTIVGSADDATSTVGTGTHTLNFTTATSSKEFYVGLKDSTNAWLPLYGTAPSGITYGTYWTGIPNAKWGYSSLSNGNYTVQFEAPGRWCVAANACLLDDPSAQAKVTIGTTTRGITDLTINWTQSMTADEFASADSIAIAYTTTSNDSCLPAVDPTQANNGLSGSCATSTIVVTSLAKSLTSYQLTGLLRDTSYSFRIIYVDSN